MDKAPTISERLMQELAFPLTIALTPPAYMKSSVTCPQVQVPISYQKTQTKNVGDRPPKTNIAKTIPILANRL